MEIIKECGVCGKEFVASKMSVKYCCRGCERVAFRRREAEKKKREKENAESLLNAERNNSLRDKAFLSPEDVSVLFDVSLPTVYRYFQTGLIKAVKIRNKTFVRYSDIERVFDDATPYRKRTISVVRQYGGVVTVWASPRYTKDATPSSARQPLTHILLISLKR